MAAAPQTDAEEDRSGLLKLAVAGLAVGALAGLVGSAFHALVDRAGALRDALVAWSHTAPWIGWLVPVVVAAAAAFLARWLVRRFAPEASGSGVQHIEAVVRGDARVTGAAVLPVKFFGGVLALGAGLALGREGPTVQMSATVGHLASRWFRLGAADARVLLAAGAGAGLAAAFNAPLAGAVFVLEELVRRFELRVAVATLAACSAALAVMRALVGDRLVFSVPAIEVDLFPGYLLFLLFGGLVGLVGVAYNRMIVAAIDLLERVRVAPELRAAAVGGTVGLVAYCRASARRRRRNADPGRARRRPLRGSARPRSRDTPPTRAAFVCPRAPRGTVRAAARGRRDSGLAVRALSRSHGAAAHDPDRRLRRDRHGGAVRRRRAGSDHRHCARRRDDRCNDALRPVAHGVRGRGCCADRARGPADLRARCGCATRRGRRTREAQRAAVRVGR